MLVIQCNGDFFYAISAGWVPLSEKGWVTFTERRRISLEQVIAQEKVATIMRNESPVAILDFDGTLVDSEKPFLRAVHVALEKHLCRSIQYEEIL